MTSVVKHLDRCALSQMKLRNAPEPIRAEQAKL